MLCFAGKHGDMWVEVCITYQVWKRRVIWINIGFCCIKIRRSSWEWKEIGTRCSHAGHCCNADDRIIKVITSLRMACVVNVCIVHNTKTSTASYMRWKQNHCYRVPISTSRTHRCCNKVKGFFLLSVSRCGISRRQAHVRRVTLGEAVILNYECSIWREFPVWDNRRYSSLAAWKWQLWKETITHAQTIVDT